MKHITTIVLDIAKKVFQVHGVDEQGQVVVQKQLVPTSRQLFGDAVGSGSAGMPA